jgi:hypothetical protein
MSEGVRAKLAVRAPESCPVAALSETDSSSTVTDPDPGVPPVRDVTWTRETDGRVVEESRVDEHVVAARPETLAEADPVMTLDDEHVYQFVRDRNGADRCVCEVVERLDCPVADVRARRRTRRGRETGSRRRVAVRPCSSCARGAPPG